MAQKITSHYEYFSEEQNIIVYAMKVEEVFPNGVTIDGDITTKITDLIPDIIQKYQVTKYSKKGIMLYSTPKETLHMK